MLKNKTSSKYKYLIVGLVVEFIATAFSLILISVFMYITNAQASFVSTLASLTLGIGSFFGSFIASKIKKSNGLINGLTISGCFFALIFIISLILGGKAFGILSLLHAAIMLLSGGIGGICGVNTKKKQII